MIAKNQYDISTIILMFLCVDYGTAFLETHSKIHPDDLEARGLGQDTFQAGEGNREQTASDHVYIRRPPKIVAEYPYISHISYLIVAISQSLTLIACIFYQGEGGMSM